MRGKGICYDAGFLHAGVSSRERFDLDVVAREMRIIHDDLHCTAVRITGGDPERMEGPPTSPPMPASRSGSRPSPPT